MKREKLHMDEALLKRYIAGELSHSEMHFVEHNLQESELWQDVHDGLLAMKEDGISIDAEIDSLQEELFKKVKPQAKKIRIAPWRYAAAAILFGVAIAGSYFVFNNLGPVNNQTAMQKANTNIEDLDRIEVITVATDGENELEQAFNEAEIEGLLVSDVIDEDNKTSDLEAEIENIISETKKLRPRRSEILTASIDHTYLKQQGYYELYAPPTDRQVRRSSGPSAPLLPPPMVDAPVITYSMPEQSIYARVDREDVTEASDAVTAEIVVSAEVEPVSDSISDLNRALAGKVAGVSVKSGSGEPGASQTVRIRGANSISGGHSIWKVLDEEGSPLLGATVRIKNSTNAAITDIDGRFNIDGLTANDSLIISYVGYETLMASPVDGIQSGFRLESSEDILDVVTIAAYGKDAEKLSGYSDESIETDDSKQVRDQNALSKQTKKKTKTSTKRKSAVPINGVNDYDKYLEYRVYEGSPWEETGKVVLDVTINKDGKVIAIAVKKSINEKQNAAAIQFVKEGGNWLPVIKDGQPQESTVEVKVKF